MSRSQRWAANKAFLDEAMTARATIFLATHPGEIDDPRRMLNSELRYLVSKGWSITVDGTMMVPPRDWP